MNVEDIRQDLDLVSNEQLIAYCNSVQIFDSLRGDNLDLFQQIAHNLQSRVSGSSLIEDGAEDLKRVHFSRKKIIGDSCDVNQLLPFKDESYFEAYRDALKNHWVPEEIGMSEDLVQLSAEGLISEAEMRIIALTLGFFAPADSIVANNIMLNLTRHITLPEARFYLIKQGFEEVLHSHSYIYIIQSYGELLPFSEAEISNMYHELPPVALKVAWGADKLNQIADPNFSLLREAYPDQESYTCALRKFLTNYIAFVAVLEGIFFYCSFVQVLALSRTGKMRKFAEQIQYIMRDETMHVKMGMKIIRDIIKDNPEVWSDEFATEVRTMVLEGLFVEMAFADYTIGDGILGLTKESMFQYLQCIADSRLSALGFEPVFNVTDPFPWMDEAIHITKEKNFFETRVTEYQVGGSLNWDD